MKINMSFPATGCQKLIEIADELKVRPFYEKRMGQEVEADTLGDEFKGYVVRITGGKSHSKTNTEQVTRSKYFVGNDKQGFPMKQGVLTNGRVRLLLSKGRSCYRPRRDVRKYFHSLNISKLFVAGRAQAQVCSWMHC